jgi:hypothetical protein
VGTSEKGVGTRKGGMRVYMLMCLVFIYENRRMKLVDIVLRREEEGK